MDSVFMAEVESYSPGDWVVHRRHGAGQIESLEEKTVGEAKSTYCKIRTHTITVWMPAEKMNDEWLRPIASPAEFRQALEALDSSPQPMPDTLNSRKKRIKDLDTSDPPIEIAELLRDMWALKKVKKMLSQAEEEALRRFTNCFLAEWSQSLKVPVDEAKQEFETMLQIGRA
jgi:RNA polymerase-interacting CarD/CdnL/TRCF family regulator